MMWRMDSELVWKYNGCGFESWLAGNLERQCTLEEEARYVNVRGSVHWKGVYRVGRWTLEVKIFLISY